MKPVTRHNAGFSLVELMFSVAIVGILTAIAIPSYQDHINKGKQAEAQAALLSLANAMGQFYLQQSPMTYIGAADSGSSTGSPSVFPEAVPPDSGDKASYHLMIDNATVNTFSISAVPVDNTLTTYMLDEKGTKTTPQGNGW